MIVGLNIRARIDGAQLIQGRKIVRLNIRALLDGAQLVQGGENCRIKYLGTIRWSAGCTGWGIFVGLNIRALIDGMGG